MSLSRIRRDMLKIVVRFAEREDGGLRAWCDELPGFTLSHSDPQAVLGDVEVALETILAEKYGCPVRVYPLTPSERFEMTQELPIPAFMIPQREYASQIC